MKTTYKLLLGLLVLVLVAGGGWWMFNARSGDELAKLADTPGVKLTDAQVDAVVARISKFMVVPDNERPSVMVLKGAAELAAQQSFYKDAKDGDIFIVYSTRAIIYDAKANKLVSVSPVVQNTATPAPSSAPVASGSAQVSPTATPPAPENVTLEVRNGTTVTGLAGKTASELKTKFSWITATKAADAAKSSYTATVLVDMSAGKKPGAIAALEAYLGVKAVTALPTGEATSTSDILVIVGK